MGLNWLLISVTVQVVRAAEDDDLMEVVLPRLVKFVSLWEFMLMKVETCNGTHPRVDHIYREFLALHKHVKRVCQEGLHAKQDTGQQNGLDGEESKDGNLDILKVSHSHLLCGFQNYIRWLDLFL